MVKEAHRNGVVNVKQIGRKDILKMEPHLNKAVLGGIFVPGESAVDPFLTPITMLHEARRFGAHVRLVSPSTKFVLETTLLYKCLALDGIIFIYLS